MKNIKYQIDNSFENIDKIRKIIYKTIQIIPNYSNQKSYLNGQEISYGSKGSVRPEYYNNHGVEEKTIT